MAVDIIEKYSGTASRSARSVSGDGDSMQVIVKDHDAGTEEIVFTGSRFSEEEYKKLRGE